jgi:hypothetical protein
LCPWCLQLQRLQWTFGIWLFIWRKPVLRQLE